MTVDAVRSIELRGDYLRNYSDALAARSGEQRDPWASEDVDACVVGAGVAGLNAASVADRSLPTGSRVAVVDRRGGPGGMWNDAYSYVRLHQPHGMFTAGDIRWRLRRDRGYLAARDEVLAHLCYCLEVIGKRITLDPRWGWNYLSHREEAGRVRLEVRAPDGECCEIVARRLVKAFGYGIEESRPLEVSSSQVRSISPSQLEDLGLLAGNDGSPVLIVGSGQTAMDTVLALLSGGPNRRMGPVVCPGDEALCGTESVRASNAGPPTSRAGTSSSPSLSHKPSALGQRPALGDFFGYFKVLSQPDQAETADLSHSLAPRGICATAFATLETREAALGAGAGRLVSARGPASQAAARAVVRAIVSMIWGHSSLGRS
jgi:hypothetical protein